jgi:predicted transcriptional regulator of viral defense system
MPDMSREADRLISRFAETHHGIVATEHTRLCGLDEYEREHRMATGQLIELYENVYRVAGVPLSWKGKLLAACWAGGFRAVASHRSAAALYGLAGGRQNPAEITCPRWLRARHSGLIVHETKALDACDIRVVDGIPVTTPERTLLDLAAVCGLVTVRMAYDKARRVDLVTRRSVERMLDRLARRGRRGVRRLRDVLASRDPHLAAPESEMETLMLEVIEQHGLPAPIPQYEIRANGRFIARVDAAYPEHRIAIEYQSTQEHAGYDPLVRDSARRNRLYTIGWRVVDVTHPELKSGGDTFCSALWGQLIEIGVAVPE